MSFCEIEVLARDHINEIADRSIQALENLELVCSFREVGEDNFLSIKIIVDNLA